MLSLIEALPCSRSFWMLVLFLSIGPAGRAGASTLPEHLRDTGLFADDTLTEIAPGMLTYSPQYPLWSDGAAKRRWIRLPRGMRIDGRDPDAWVFPVGTRVWKEFSGGRRRETRLIVRTASGWVYGTYRWNVEGTDAVLVPSQGAVEIDPGYPGGRYVFPSHSDCVACHEGRPTPILGFSALQLSSDRDPAAVHGEPLPPGSVDLRSLVERGLIRGLPRIWTARPPRIGAASDVERAALGYLHGNCGQCHNARGPLAQLGLDLWHDPGRATGEEPGAVSTIGQVGNFRSAAQPGSPTVRVSPGHPERSAVVIRMGSRQPAVQMPPLATRVVDQEAVAQLSRWIEGLQQRREASPHAVRTRSTP